MKFAILSVLILFSQISFAQCPSLVGKWFCKEADKESGLVEITQQEIQNGSYYRIQPINSDDDVTDIYADGVIRQEERNGSIFTTFAQCRDSQTVSSHLKVVDQNHPAQYKMDMKMTLVSAQQFLVHAELDADINGHKEYKVMDVICLRE